MPTTNHLICYLGRNTSGKSFRANLLVKDQNYVKVSMADALRELALKSLDWRPENEEEYEKFKYYYYEFCGLDCFPVDSFSGREYLKNLGEGCKELFGEDFWVKQWIKKVLELGDFPVIIDKHIIESSINNSFNNKHTQYMTGSELKEAVGDDLPEGWTINSDARLITTDDIRFPIEVESAHKLGATFIWCDYQKGEYNNDTHPSEALANSILTSGKYTDGDEIEYNELKTFF